MSLSEFADATPRDTYNLILAGQEKRQEEIEQQWDYTRHIMWAALSPHITKTIRITDLIRLKRDGLKVELTPFQQQELAKWDEEMDKEMIEAGFTLKKFKNE